MRCNRRADTTPHYTRLRGGLCDCNRSLSDSSNRTWIRRITTLIASSILCLVPILSWGDECAVLTRASTGEAADYLRSEVSAAVPTTCVEQAFQRIASLPAEEAVSLLVELLGWKRPLSAAEHLGIFIHPNTPDNLYPAVSTLFRIGAPAEPGVIRFLHSLTRKTIWSESMQSIRCC